MSRRGHSQKIPKHQCLVAMTTRKFLSKNSQECITHHHILSRGEKYGYTSRYIFKISSAISS